MTINGDTYEEILRKLAAAAEISGDQALENENQADAELYGRIAETLSNAATRIETHKADWQLYA